MHISLVMKETFEEYGKFDNYKCCIDSMIQFNFDVFLVNAFVNWVDFSVLGMILKSGDLMHLLIDRVLFNCCVHFTANITEPDDESEGKNINQSQFSLRSS